MQVISAIDDIFSEVRGSQKKGAGQIEITLGKDGQPNPGFFSRATTYRLRPEEYRDLAPMIINLRDFRDSRTVPITLKCAIAIASEATLRAAQFFHANNDVTAGEACRREIVAAVASWWANVGPGIELPPEEAVGRNHAAIAARLNAWGTRHGLRVHPAFEPREVVPQSQELSTSRFAVRCVDFPGEEVMLRVTLEMRRLASFNRMDENAPAYPDQWIALIEQACRDAVKTKVTAEIYYHRPDLFRDILGALLNQTLARFGREIGWLKIETDPLKRDGNIHYDLSYDWEDLSGRKVPFAVRLEALVLPQDEIRYLGAGKPDIRKWLERNLAEATNSILLEKYFTYLTEDGLRVFRQALQNAMEARAAKAGITLRTLVAMPKLEELDWAKDSSFQIDGEDGFFQTADPGFKAEILIKIFGRIPALDPVRELLWPNNILRERLVSVVRETVEQILLSTESSDYFLRFAPWTDGQPGTVALEGPAECVSDRLKRTVTEVLFRRFGFVLRDAAILQIDSAVKKKVEEIAALPDERFEFAAKPFDRSADAWTFPVEALVEINGVDNSRIRLMVVKGRGREELSAWLRNELQEILEKRPCAEYKVATRETVVVADQPAIAQSVLRQTVTQALERRARDAFGIGVSILQFRVGRAPAQDVDLYSENLVYTKIQNDYRAEETRLALLDAERMEQFEHDRALRRRQREADLHAQERLMGKRVEAIDYTHPQDIADPGSDKGLGAGSLDESQFSGWQEQKAVEGKGPQGDAIGNQEKPEPEEKDVGASGGGAEGDEKPHKVDY